VLLAVPMILLFELGLFVARRITPRERAGEAQTPTEEQMDAELDRHERELAAVEKRSKE